MRRARASRFEMPARDRAEVVEVESDMLRCAARKHWQRVLTRMALLDRDLSVNEKADLLAEISRL